jgi:hypothetical protein
MSFDDLDRKGLVSLGRRWTPKGLVSDPVAKRMVESLIQAAAHALNPLLDMESYLPIILNPRRCADGDLYRSLEMNGIDVRGGSLSFDKLRRLAMLAPDLRSWRGSFRAHRTVASALTAGPVIVRSWISQRVITGSSTMAVTLLYPENVDETLLFVLGQGPSAEDFVIGEVEDRIDELAKPVLDSVDVVETFALTSWRNGVGGWVPVADPGFPDEVESDVPYEFEAMALGPGVSATVIQFLMSPTAAPEEDGDASCWWTTVFFKTAGAAEGDVWEHWVYSDPTGPFGAGDGYVVRIPVGTSQNLTVHRVVGGVPTQFGSHPFTICNSPTSGGYHRLDVVCSKSANTSARVRVYVDHDPSPWFDDSGSVMTRPAGVRTFTGLRTSLFTTGRLRVAAITAASR